MPKSRGPTFVSNKASPTRVWVGHLHRTVDETVLRQAFSKYGTVVKVFFCSRLHASHHEPDEELFAAFVNMSSAAEAQVAIAALHNKCLVANSKPIIARLANPTRESDSVSTESPKRSLTAVAEHTESLPPREHLLQQRDAVRREPDRLSEDGHSDVSWLTQQSSARNIDEASESGVSESSYFTSRWLPDDLLSVRGGASVASERAAEHSSGTTAVMARLLALQSRVGAQGVPATAVSQCLQLLDELDAVDLDAARRRLLRMY